MPQPPKVEQIRDELLELYRAAQRSIEEQLEAILSDPGTVLREARLQRRLRELSDSIGIAMSDLDDQARTWVARRYPAVYELGAADGVVGRRPFTWSAIHREAVTELAHDTYNDLLAASAFVRRDAKALIQEAARIGSRSVLLEGQTPTQAARSVAARLRERGVAAVRYRNGARHSIGDYSDVVLRTKTAEAYNVGTLVSLRDGGVAWVEVIDGPDCGWSTHEDGDLAHGTVRRLEDALAHRISHPRCARSFGGRPDVTSTAEAKAARRFTDEEQLRLAREERARVAQSAGGGRRPRPRQVHREARRRQRDERAARAQRVPTAPARSALSSVPRGVVGRGVDDALSAIESVHQVPVGLPQVPVKPSTARSYHGQYEFGLGATPAPRSIRLSTAGSDPHHAHTFAHEFGHYLDHVAGLLGQAPGSWGTGVANRDHALMKRFFAATDASPSIRRLREMAKTESRTRLARYYVQRNETWARAYAQWITIRSGQPRLLQELAGIRSHWSEAARLSQWDDAEFEPIAVVLDAIFRDRGLL